MAGWSAVDQNPLASWFFFEPGQGLVDGTLHFIAERSVRGPGQRQWPFGGSPAVGRNGPQQDQSCQTGLEAASAGSSRLRDCGGAVQFAQVTPAAGWVKNGALAGATARATTFCCICNKRLWREFPGRDEEREG